MWSARHDSSGAGVGKERRSDGQCVCVRPALLTHTVASASTSLPVTLTHHAGSRSHHTIPRHEITPTRGGSTHGRSIRGGKPTDLSSAFRSLSARRICSSVSASDCSRPVITLPSFLNSSKLCARWAKGAWVSRDAASTTAADNNAHEKTPPPPSLAPPPTQGAVEQGRSPATAADR